MFKLSSPFRKFNLDEFKSSGDDYELYETYVTLIPKLHEVEGGVLVKYLNVSCIPAPKGADRGSQKIVHLKDDDE